MFLFRTLSTLRLVAVLLSLGIHQSIWETVSYLRGLFALYLSNIVFCINILYCYCAQYTL